MNTGAGALEEADLHGVDATLAGSQALGVLLGGECGAATHAPVVHLVLELTPVLCVCMCACLHLVEGGLLVLVGVVCLVITRRGLCGDLSDTCTACHEFQQLASVEDSLK